jgi:alcohol dehydrogenase
MEFNGSCEVGARQYQKVAKGLGIYGSETMTGEESVSESVALIRRLSKEIGLVGCLRELSVDPDFFYDLAKGAMLDACMEDNPVKPTVKEVAEVYKKAYYGV